MNELDKQYSAYEASGPYYEESMMTCRWFAERMIQRIRSQHYRTLISLGVGYTAVNESVIRMVGEQLKHYWIVDGSAQMLDKVKRDVALSGNTKLVQEWFEKFDPQETVDAIEMNCILEHVDDPLSLLTRYAKILNPGGTLFIAVPNAQALHRRIGLAAGLIDDLYYLSEYDRGFGHQRYFDQESLRQVVEQAGFTVRSVAGIMLKPLTTGQLRQLHLSEQVMNALFQVGVDFPELANSIYLEAGR